MLTEVKRNIPYSEKVYLQLKRSIITNSLKPGEVLNERELASILNVSRTPLRDALNLLQKDGWVTSAGKNRIVTPITWKDIQEIYEIRLVNEALALDLAARTFSEATSQQMENMLSRMATLVKTSSFKVEYLEEDKSFHLYIAEIGGNERLFNLMKGICEQFVRIGYITFKKSDLRLAESHEEHLKIYQACKKGDYDEAKKASRLHIEAWFNSLNENWEDIK